MDKQSLYERIGGQATIEALTARFYALMDSMPEARATRAIHPDDLSGSREKLTEYLAFWFGGPQTFVEKRGAPMMRARHLPFAIGTAEIEGWLGCFRQALDETVPEDHMRAVIWERVETLAHHMRNRDG